MSSELSITPQSALRDDEGSFAAGNGANWKNGKRAVREKYHDRLKALKKSALSRPELGQR